MGPPGEGRGGGGLRRASPAEQRRRAAGGRAERGRVGPASARACWLVAFCFLHPNSNGDWEGMFVTGREVAAGPRVRGAMPFGAGRQRRGRRDPGFPPASRALFQHLPKAFGPRRNCLAAWDPETHSADPAPSAVLERASLRLLASGLQAQETDKGACGGFRGLGHASGALPGTWGRDPEDVPQKRLLNGSPPSQTPARTICMAHLGTPNSGARTRLPSASTRPGLPRSPYTLNADGGLSRA